MVVLSVSVCNKKGKILLARQYVPMSRLRIEGLLSAFPKLIDSEEHSTSKQHTYIETNEVRYIYQPLDALYLLLVTNMQSNILEDLDTLRKIAKLVPEYCGGHDEETVSENAFNLLYALDEVVTPMGYKEAVTYKQIEDFVKMDSAEEKLSEIIEKSKEENARDIMKKRANELDKARREEMKKAAGVSPNSMGYKGLDSLNAITSKFGGGGGSNVGGGGGGGLSSNAIKMNALSSDTYFGQLGHESGGAGKVVIEQHDYSRKKKGKFGANDDSDEDASYASSSSRRRKKESKISGMSLTKKKGGDALAKRQAELDEETLDSDKYRRLLEATSRKSGVAGVDALAKRQAELDEETLDSDKYRRLLEATSRKSGVAGVGDEDDELDMADLSPVQILISEKLFVQFDRDGALQKFEVKGDMEVAVNDPDCTQCVLLTNIAPTQKVAAFGRPNWRLHPRMDGAAWKKGVLCLKEKQKKFRVGRSSKTSILKWRMSTDDDAHIPISIEFWPDADASGNVNVNATFTVGDIDLKNVIITFPSTCSHEPEIQNCERGDTSFSRQHHEFQWILQDLEAGSQGAMEYSMEDVQVEDLWPISVHFEVDRTYSNIQIEAVHDAEQEENAFKFEVKEICVADKYVVES
eukprot:CAMPEP_0202729668 /NCGR_PEP_ID=MMETSP1385-20130828/186247_1 /ASSEMBLY_ACC=CAM_ASM_000861 /TAXON_ID=933848 /ORGANISM="Elphidium margaritaceum" /LENGTH=635 /DNA_ID=CAMNT_0049395935 /DNA_START=44 /DNA_END=1951 /DNA_ORIENTATION=-